MHCTFQPWFSTALKEQGSWVEWVLGRAYGLSAERWMAMEQERQLLACLRMVLDFRPRGLDVLSDKKSLVV